MKPVIRYQSQLPARRSYKPRRADRLRAASGPKITFRPARGFGAKPQLEIVS